jgi:ribonuclease-3
MKFTSLESKINYIFTNYDLLQLALTHRSFSSLNNQRLEYLGDAVLDCIIASELYKLYPKDREGQLSEHRSSLVNQQSLAIIARDFKLYRYMLLGPGEKRSSNMNDSILADTVEAVIGAIYLDKGFDKCKTVVLQWFQSMLQDLPKNTKNSKSALQELCQLKSYAIPIYKIVSMTGLEHAKIFEISCTIDQIKHITYGKGKSKRSAEQYAAKLMLKWIKDDEK